MVNCIEGSSFANLSASSNASCNGTLNGTRAGTLLSEDPVSKWGVLMLVQICCYVLIAVVGSLGNILTIIVLLKPQNRSKTSSILLLNLAVCDVCIAAIGIPLDLGELVPGNWYYGKALCSVIYPFQTSLPMISSWTLMFMLAERNMIFSRHITTGLRARAVRCLALLTWILPLGLVVPYGFQLSLLPGKTVGTYQCTENWPRPLDRQIYTIALFVTEYLIPIVAITLFVGNIGSYLRTERKSVRSNVLGLDKRTSKRRLRTNIRLTMIFIVIVTLYAALKLPNNVFWLWVEFGGGGNSHHFDTIWTSVALSSYSTSMTNPFVLGAMSADFRKEFIYILTCRFCCFCKDKSSTPFSPFSSTTMVSYRRINRLCSAATDISISDRVKSVEISVKSTCNGKQKPLSKSQRSPNRDRKSKLLRASTRRKTVKYKYEDLLPESGGESPESSPGKSSPVAFVEPHQERASVDGSSVMKVLSISPDNDQSGVSVSCAMNGETGTNQLLTEKRASQPSLSFYFPEPRSDCIKGKKASVVPLARFTKSCQEISPYLVQSSSKAKQGTKTCLKQQRRSECYPDPEKTKLSDASTSTGKMDFVFDSRNRVDAKGHAGTSVDNCAMESDSTNQAKFLAEMTVMKDYRETAKNEQSHLSGKKRQSLYEVNLGKRSDSDNPPEKQILKVKQSNSSPSLITCSKTSHSDLKKLKIDFNGNSFQQKSFTETRNSSCSFCKAKSVSLPKLTTNAIEKPVRRKRETVFEIMM